MMHGHEKSRSAIVAVKPMNKAERSAAESVERRAGTKGNVDQQRTRRTQRRISVSQMLARIRQHIVAVDTRGGNRMRESCTYGSVRGVRGNSHPYRAPPRRNLAAGAAALTATRASMKQIRTVLRRGHALAEAGKTAVIIELGSDQKCDAAAEGRSTGAKPDN